MSQRAAGDGGKVAELLLRAYAQASDPPARSEILDLIDQLLLLGAYGMEQLIDDAQR